MKKKITRNEAIIKMASFYDSIPENASSFHKMDMILRILEKHIGMLPPAEYSFENNTHSGCTWKEEPEEDESIGSL